MPSLKETGRVIEDGDHSFTKPQPLIIEKVHSQKSHQTFKEARLKRHNFKKGYLRIANEGKLDNLVQNIGLYTQEGELVITTNRK